MKKILKAWFQLAAWKQILCGLVGGIIAGLVLKEKADYLQPIGVMFIHAIQMLVVPVVFTAIVCAIISLKDFQRTSKIVSKAFVVYGLSMLAATVIGIVVANLFNVGHGFSMVNPDAGSAAPAKLNMAEAIVNFVPTSPVAAFAANNIVQILCFSILFAVALRLVGEKGKPVQDFFLSLSNVVFLLSKIIMKFAPYGIFALIAGVFGHYGMNAVLPLVNYITAMYVSDIVLIGVLFTVVLALNGITPKYFFKNALNPLVTAYTTSSSAATLPVTMRCARENLKIDRSLSDFLVPLGTTLNVNGVAIYLSVATVFAANIFGVHLGLAEYVTLVITILLTSVGGAALPGAALIVMGAAMTSVGVPLGALPLIAGVDRINDMAQTMTNVAADLFAVTLVAKSEGMLNVEKNSTLVVNE